MKLYGLETYLDNSTFLSYNVTSMLDAIYSNIYEQQR